MDTASESVEKLSLAPANNGGWLPEIAVLMAAIVGRMPALGAWWNLDDWGQLARSAGMDTGTAVATIPARWLSQHLYWDLTWPLFGLDSDAHALVRLLLHGVAAALVTRIAWRSGLGTLPRLVAGLVFAASPLAFTPLYWASGIQEILAAVFALGAVERWLSAPTGGRSRLVWAAVLAVLSMTSKESGLGLPILFLIFAWMRIGVRLEDKAFAWAIIMMLLPFAVAEGALVFNHFGTAADQPYALGGALEAVLNLGVCGWWLISPGPILAANISLPMAIAGGLLLAAWAGWGAFQWRRREPLVLLALAAAVFVLAPALPLKKQLVPYLCYLAVAPFGLLAGSIAQQVKVARLSHLGALPILGFMTLVAMAWGFLGMETRLANRDGLGLVADPVARATALSWQGCNVFETLQDHPTMLNTDKVGLTHLTLLQPLVDPMSTQLAGDMGERWTRPSEIYEALGGLRGPRLVLGPDVQVNWANGLTTASTKSVVLCETGTGFRMWGRLENALLYAALTDVGLGHFERARGHLKRAAEISGEQIMFIYDEGQMVVPLEMALNNREAFTDWTLGLLDQNVTRMEVGGLQDMFFNLLTKSTGRSLEELTAGSQVLTNTSQPSSQP